MIEYIMWILLVVVLTFSLWYNYHHFNVLLTGRITLKEVILAVGSIVLSIILFVTVIILRFI